MPMAIYGVCSEKAEDEGGKSIGGVMCQGDQSCPSHAQRKEKQREPEPEPGDDEV